MMRYVASVSYPLSKFEVGDLDKKILKAIGIEPDGSGAGFGERDLSFTFPNPESRKKAIRNVKRRVGGISVSMFEYNV